MKVASIHSSLIVKRIPTETLLQSFVRKVADNLEKYFNRLDDTVKKEESVGRAMFDMAGVRTDTRSDLGTMVELIARKLTPKLAIDRQQEE